MSKFAVDRRGTVKAEISKDGKTVLVKFPYHPERVVRIKGGDYKDKTYKGVPSRRFVPKEHASGEGPAWRVNLDLDTMRRLREVFGEELAIGPKLREWGHQKVGKERNLAGLADANDAKLEVISPAFQKWLRPYQRADVKFMSATNVLNANQPRTGKTPTLIASVIEAGLMWGQHLVFAPLQALRDVWELGILNAYLRQQINKEPRRWHKDWTQEDYHEAYEFYKVDMPTILTGDTPDERRAAIEEASELAEGGYSFWLVLNPYMGRAKTEWRIGRKVYDKFEKIPKEQRAKAKEQTVLLNPLLADIEWDSVSVDEFHLCGLSNPNTITAQGMNLIRKETDPTRAHALSGTPMGGKPIKLWGALHFIDPETFTSRWNWARMWLTIQENEYGSQIEGLAPGIELDFYNHLKPYLVRRTQRDALPGLPPVNRIPVWCEMTPKQREQYEKMQRDAEWALEDMEEQGRLAATNVLALYTRLKQFADAYCDVEKTGKETEYGLPELKVQHTDDSGKLLMLLEKLEECNVIGQGDDDEDLKCALIASQFVPMTEMLCKALEARGVPVARMIAGKKRQNEEIKQAFQTQADGAPRVLVMNTLMGTALTLDRAETVHLLDETWNPDDQEQMEQRATPTTKELMKARADLGVYYYRSRRSIDEYIQKVNKDKEWNNRTILDLRHRMQEAMRELEQA